MVFVVQLQKRKSSMDYESSTVMFYIRCHREKNEHYTENKSMKENKQG